MSLAGWLEAVCGELQLVAASHQHPEAAGQAQGAHAQQWVHFRKQQHDILGEPHWLVEVLYRPADGTCYDRVFGKTVSRAKVSSEEEIRQHFRNTFNALGPCLGLTPSSKKDAYISPSRMVVTQPFERIVSKRCQGFVIANINGSSTRCKECELESERKCHPCGDSIASLLRNVELLSRHVDKLHRGADAAAAADDEDDDDLFEASQAFDMDIFEDDHELEMDDDDDDDVDDLDGAVGGREMKPYVKAEPAMSEADEDDEEDDDDDDAEEDDDEAAAKAANLKLMKRLKWERTGDKPFPVLKAKTNADGEPVCDFCDDRPFFDMNKWRDHVYTVHYKAKYFCLHCADVFHFPQDIEAHIRTAHGHDQQNTICPFCSDIVQLKPTDADSFFTHCRECKRARRQKKRKPCHVCGKEVSKYTYESHVATHYRRAQVQSKKTKKAGGSGGLSSVRRRGNRQRAIKPEENSEGQLLCHLCGEGRAFASFRQWQDHNFSVHYKNKYRCEYCDLMAHYPQDIEAHVVEAHPATKTVRCPYCEASVAVGGSAEPMLAHCRSCKRNRNAGAKVPCQLCGKFMDRPNLAKHLKYVHEKSAEDQAACELCGKVFSNAAVLYQHRNRAHGTAHRCPHCERSFGIPYMLKKHITEAHAAPEFACAFCGKTFKRKKQCLEHERTHTGEPKHQCEYCVTTFDSADALSKHFQGRHPDLQMPSVKNE